MTTVTGAQLGRFKILRRLAVGGMAEVYLASETLGEGIDRVVVLKTLLKDKRDDEEFVTMFFDEARLLSHLCHPNVVQVFATGTHGPDSYMAVEYVRGASLRDLLAAATHTPRGALDEAVAVSIGITLAETLAYVHDALDEEGRPLNIVHRDLTPANVMLSYDGAVKLIDFGIAQGEDRVYETTAGVLKGTCGYMAPEQLQMQQDMDRRADIFAFGVMMYEATTGTHPFTVKNPAELYDRILEARYTPPQRVRRDLSPSLAELITTCMSRRADDRPSDMRVVATWLRSVLVSAGQLPLMAELGDLVRQMFPRHRTDEIGGGDEPKTDPQMAAPAAGEWVTQVDDG